MVDLTICADTDLLFLGLNSCITPTCKCYLFQFRYSSNVGELTMWRNWEVVREVKKYVKLATGVDIENSSERADLICRIIGNSIS